jgi:hypothetical protein
MMFSVQNNFNLEEEEEDEEDAGIDDALLGELEADDALIDEEIDPLVKATLPDPLIPEEEEAEKDGEVKIFEDDDEEEDMDYDSFDDHDEL